MMMSTEMGGHETSRTAGRDDGYGIAPAGQRLPASIHLGRVRLQVGDLDRSQDYYTDVLGLRVLDRSDGVAVLGTAEGDGILIELHERKGAAPVPPGGRPGLYHFAILLPDRASLARFVGHIAAVGARAGASDHLVSEALYLQDPDGLGIEVYADRPRSAWRHRDRQIEMTTAPLNVAALREAAGDTPWRGMPAGTVIGHVHLHVGDIDLAARFYHDALGLDKVVWSYPGALFLSAGGYHHHLGVNTWATGTRPAGEADARLLDWEIVVPTAADAAAALDSLESAGNPVERTGDGGAVTDPWGTVLRITAAVRGHAAG
jgi:catechol 2,3-dioxygenase